MAQLNRERKPARPGEKIAKTSRGRHEFREGGEKFLWRTAGLPDYNRSFAALKTDLPRPIAGKCFMADVDLAGHRGVPGIRQARRGAVLSIGGAFLIAVGFATPSPAADLGEAEKSFRVGRYEDAAKLAGQETATGSWVERWHLLKVRAELAQGLYPAALASLEDGLRRLPASIALQLLGREVYRFNGRDDDASATLDAIEARIQLAPSRYATPEGRLLLGRYFLLRGADAKKVLDQCYDIALKQRPELVEGFLATAELALDKQDGALASTTLARAPKASAEEPRYHYLMARAFDETDRARSEKALDEALKINPRHADSLLLRASHRIDDERYADASALLKQVFAINPQEPRAWAYQAVLAHLQAHPDGEAAARKAALARWATNPEVDHLIGRELSAKYRFLEGSSYQNKALEIDPEYLPAKVQLCQDLLRLGREDEGWKLASEIFAQDGYNVLAYNLTTLRDRIASFRTIQEDGFLVRMDPREAELYGPRVVALLRKAKKTLGEKYGVSIPEPVTVEIFPAKKEFAVRTFGLPGAEGFLGVCFGSVITANSPASQGESPSNWEAVLWHEYCHVVTLNKTKNKMPRWLSEGISVFEEEKEDPAWGSPLTPPLPGDDPGRGLHAAQQAQLGVSWPRSRGCTSSSPTSSRPWRSSSWSRRRACRPCERCSTTSAPGSRSTNRCHARPR